MTGVRRFETSPLPKYRSFANFRATGDIDPFLPFKIWTMNGRATQESDFSRRRKFGQKRPVFRRNIQAILENGRFKPAIAVKSLACRQTN
jgi:hypothetical protein